MKVAPTAAVARSGALRFAAARAMGCRHKPELRILRGLPWAGASAGYEPLLGACMMQTLPGWG